MAPTIFVTAATGTIGNAVAHDLIKAGCAVNTTTRNPESQAAKGLATAGVNVLTGDWDNEEVLKQAMLGCDGLFMNLMPDLADLTSDLKQGRRILAIAKAAGVKHAIYSTSVGANYQGTLPYSSPGGLFSTLLNTKKTLEGEVRNAGFDSYTIFRPGGFMANWVVPKVDFIFAGFAKTGINTTGMKPDSLLSSIDEHDVAAFAIAAFKDPARFDKQEIELSSELQTVEEVLRELSEATGRELKAVYLTDEEIAARVGKDLMLESQLNANAMVKLIDMAKVKKWGIPLTSFKQWLEREKNQVEKTYNHK
ncbi:Uu.00g129780.m01.CDS01 [Anthostomella pinea]|uniref:Uu.00g129780.m01.CDS01 n=1 Tax=Anthostomella pinea TaxID=933095 RepID=A0AAI8VII9_9PEZI|nr:Uu.00g129780.m01.CDS01 [Anthostomella pinea]